MINLGYREPLSGVRLLFSYFRVIRWPTSLVADNTGTDKRGRVVEWVEKASFDILNKLFEIAAGERSYQTLLST